MLSREALARQGMDETADQPADGFPVAFEAAFARLQVAVETACATGPDWPSGVAAAVGAALRFATSYPTAAQVLTNEAMANGRAGFARYDRMIDHFAVQLTPGRRERPQGQWLPEITERAMVGGLASLIAQRLDLGRHDELPGIAREAIQFVLTPYLGTAEAIRVAAAAATSSERRRRLGG